VLVWLATVFLCGLEVMKYKTTLKGPGKDSMFTAFGVLEENYVSGIVA